MTDRVLNMLGIAKKAGAVSAGGFLCEDAVRRGKACLVILANDASKNTSKSITDVTTYYKVSLVTYGTKDSLGRAIGCEQRAAVAILSQGIAEKIVNLIHIGGTLNGNDQGQ